MKKTVALIILDGYGLSDDITGNAVKQAKTPFLDTLFTTYPHNTLKTSGEAVGLPEGQMGNSEVGHLNLGAGRIVYQSLTRINKSIRDGDFYTNQAFLDAIAYAKTIKVESMFLDSSVMVVSMLTQLTLKLCFHLKIRMMFQCIYTLLWMVEIHHLMEVKTT